MGDVLQRVQQGIWVKRRIPYCFRLSDKDARIWHAPDRSAVRDLIFNLDPYIRLTVFTLFYAHTRGIDAMIFFSPWIRCQSAFSLL